MKRRNVLFMFADQMHGFAMSCMDDPNAHTPHLNQLARRGTLFRSCYSNAPVCSPFRVNLMSGLYGSRTNALRNEASIPDWVETLPESLNNAGYCTSYVGKWHIGDTGNQAVRPELRAGFTEFIGYQGYNSYLDEIWFWDEDGNGKQYEGHRTDVTTDIAIDRLRRRAAADSPFALFVSYQNPHYPEEPGQSYYDELYRGRKIIRRKNAQDIDPFTPTASPPSPKPFYLDKNNRRYGNDLDEYLRCYYAMVAQLDANVGRLIAELDALGIADETLVVFTSDHGDMQGSHGLKNKSVPFEESTRIPLIVREPGAPEGQVVETPVSGVDFPPTLLDWAGVEPVTTHDGRSILAALRDPDALPVEPVFSEMRGWCMIRDGRYKFSADRLHDEYALVPKLLFDLEDDPHELHNRVDNPRYKDVQSSLWRKLEEWDHTVRPHWHEVHRLGPRA